VEEIPRAIKVILEIAGFPIRLLSLKKNKLILAFIVIFLIKITLFLDYQMDRK
jgi:hypothetical protein